MKTVTLYPAQPCLTNSQTPGGCIDSRASLFSMLVVCLLLVVSTGAQALQLHYTDDREPELLECDQLALTGKQADARQCYQQLLALAEEDATTLTLKAAAAHALGEFKTANRLYREITQLAADAKNTTRWGNLYLQAHQPGEASALYREAMQIDEEYLPAQLGLASAQARQFESRAREMITEIIRQHPNSVHALLLMARIELELQRVEPARALLALAESLASQQGLPVLEIYALQASADLLQGITDSAWTTKALQLNPHYGGIYDIPAHFYIITYRYREAVDLYRKATEIEPGLADAQSNLGINLLRTNDLNGARRHLELAYEIDPFNTETVNTLRLMDDLDAMRVSYADILPEESRRADPTQSVEPIGRMLLRLDREAADALEPYVVELTANAVRLFTERYDFKLEKPVVVELYHNHDDFGVRTVSTPGVGLLGVTFGYVLAMDSPKARSTADFHWGSTLWHELAHVFTLEAANHLLPRWFSEGISVYEEWNTGPLPNRELPIQVLQMFEADKFLPVADLDRGFVRPSYEGQVNVSYMQAGLICDYISARWGHDALKKMLKSFSRGETTAQAISAALSISSTEFDSLFQQHMATRYETILDKLDAWGQLGQVIANSIDRSERQGAELLTNDWAQIVELGRQRVQLYPEFVGNGNAYLPLAKALAEDGDVDGALEVRFEWFERGGSVPDVLVQLAKDLRLAQRDEDSFRVLEAMNWVMPYFADEHRQLGQYYLQKGDYARAIREFDALIGVRPKDASVALFGKAQAYKLQQNTRMARINVLLALESAPFYRDAQRLLLELTAGD